MKGNVKAATSVLLEGGGYSVLRLVECAPIVLAVCLAARGLQTTELQGLGLGITVMYGFYLAFIEGVNEKLTHRVS